MDRVFFHLRQQQIPPRHLNYLSWEKEHQDHNGNSSNNNSGTSSKNVNTANVAATVKGPNDTQMGQVMNEVGVIAGGGNDSSIAASYQFPLLLLVFAMVAVASP
ncbi:hypothetical protein LSM04_000670 [Trypanosoma melophagium]|uniref:uncharacterized protein n=1 Tax=Trypanosoma melophagium TaxID=715481 RepID=UPI00351A9794|nr:hypothetical protein LSM04_000670 [Trypanosoma melophagium]